MSRDLDDLRALLQQLLGQPFRASRVAYGDELGLHLGDMVAYSNPRMAGRWRGSYVLGVRATSWAVEPSGCIAAGAVVVAATPVAEPVGFSLDLVFSDGSRLFVRPSPDGEDATPEAGDVEVSDWELLTPHARILRVGPGARWCYVDSEAGERD